MSTANYYRLVVAEINDQSTSTSQWTPKGYVIDLVTVRPTDYATTLLDPKFPDTLKNLSVALCRTDAQTKATDAKLTLDLRVAFFAGARSVIYCIDGMDKVNYDQKTYNDLVKRIQPLAKAVGFADSDVYYIPISTTANPKDNVDAATKKMTWYKGLCVQKKLDEAKPVTDLTRPLRARVDALSSASGNQTKVSFTVKSGVMNTGATLYIAPSDQTATVVKLGPHTLNSSAAPVSQVTAGSTGGAFLAEQLKSTTPIGCYLCDPTNCPLVSAKEVTVILNITNSQQAILLSRLIAPPKSSREAAVSFAMQTFQGTVKVSVEEIIKVMDMSWNVRQTNATTATGAGLYEMRLVPETPVFVNTYRDSNEYSKVSFTKSAGINYSMGNGFILTITPS